MYCVEWQPQDWNAEPCDMSMPQVMCPPELCIGHIVPAQQDGAWPAFNTQAMPGENASARAITPSVAKILRPIATERYIPPKLILARKGDFNSKRDFRVALDSAASEPI